MKRILVFSLILFAINFSFAENNNKKTLYRGGIYGQTFELTEYIDGDKCRLLLFMGDNKTKQTTTYDSTLQTAYFIWSKWFTNPREYSKAVESSKNFFDYSMCYVCLSEMKDICDIAPCCKSLNYRIKETNNKEEYIYLEYDCSDLDLLFEIAEKYNHKGRYFVLKNYVK